MAELTMVQGEGRRSDAELLAAVADRDRAALAELYARHEPWLTARIARRCADRQIVEEVVQDTFVTAWRLCAALERRRRGGGLAVGHRHPPAPPAPAASEEPAREAPEGPRAGQSEQHASAEEQVLLGVQHGQAGIALDRLSPELRAVVQATVLDGLTTNEAARLLGIPAGTVKTRMMRARPRSGRHWHEHWH